MDDQSLRQCLLVHRLEEADASGTVLPRDDRRRLTEDAGGAGRSGIRVLLPRRARMVLESLSRRSGETVAPLNIGGFRWLWIAGLAVCVLAFVSGLAMNQLSNSDAINILAAPFIAVIVWNLFIYLFMILRRFVRRRGMAERIVGWWRMRMSSAPGKKPEGLIEEVQMGELADWTVRKVPLVGAQAGFWLHLSAAVLALGMITGMYGRGLVKNYQAYWESTFLSEDQREALVGVIYRPASAITGLSLDDDHFKRLEGRRGDAKIWIHLGAASLGLFVISPRLLLALGTLMAGRARWAWAKSRMVEDLEPYFDRLVRVASSDPNGGIKVIASGRPPDARTLELIGNVSSELWGKAGSPNLLGTVGYGEEEMFTQLSLGDLDGPTVLVFPLSATPEDETQGLLARGVRHASPNLVVAMLDAVGFEARFGEMEEYEDRLAGRVAAWTNVLETTGCAIVVIEGDDSPEEVATKVAEVTVCDQEAPKSI